MNPYQFVRRKAAAEISAKEIKEAKTLVNFAEMLNAAKVASPYEFAENSEATTFFRKAKAVEIIVDELPSGAEVNRAKVATENGNFRLRVFGAGSKSIIPAKVLTADEIKQIRVGTCTSDGETITEPRTDSATGEVVNVPVLYLHI